jgi:hypothetical protein
MLRMRVEVVPYGVEEATTAMRTVYIGNDGTGTRAFGHYDVYVEDPRGEDKSEGRDKRPGWVGCIRRFPRTRGRVALAGKALRLVDGAWIDAGTRFRETTPECESGYTSAQVKYIMGPFEPEFNRWMAGRTKTFCEGRRYDHETREYKEACGGVAHGIVCYPWDMERFLGT